jgi:molybdate transport system substrate-binding protein
MDRRVVFVALALLAALPACGKRKKQGEGNLRVAGASDLVFVMDELVKGFEKKTGAKVDFVPGSSGKLATQIKEGAPFDVFFSANEKFIDDVIESGACAKGTKKMYARGRIVMWSREGGVAPPATLDGLSDAKYARIAIAQPEHAPYGKAAKEALEKLGVWAAVEPRVVYASNIKETMQMAETGNADIAIIALSLAVKSRGAHVDIPADLHAPIDQALAVCNNGKQKALGQKFADHATEPASVELLKQYGFAQP